MQVARDKDGKGFPKPKPSNQVVNVKTVKETEKVKGNT